MGQSWTFLITVAEQLWLLSYFPRLRFISYGSSLSNLCISPVSSLRKFCVKQLRLTTIRAPFRSPWSAAWRNSAQYLASGLKFVQRLSFASHSLKDSKETARWDAVLGLGGCQSRVAIYAFRRTCRLWKVTSSVVTCGLFSGISVLTRKKCLTRCVRVIFCTSVTSSLRHLM